MTKDDCGMCLECGEWTNLYDSCCGGRVEFEGGIFHTQDLESEDDEKTK